MAVSDAEQLLDDIANNTNTIRDRLINELDPDLKKDIICNDGYNVSKQNMLDALAISTKGNSVQNLQDVANLLTFSEAAFSATIQQ